MKQRMATRILLIDGEGGVRLHERGRRSKARVTNSETFETDFMASMGLVR